MTDTIEVVEICSLCKGTGKIGGSHVIYNCPVCGEKKTKPVAVVEATIVAPLEVKPEVEIPLTKKKGGRPIGWRKNGGKYNTGSTTNSRSV